MTLAFPNSSRSFDQVRNAVRFFGYDGMFEIQFFVEAAALIQRGPKGVKLSEEECLSAFDTMRSNIYTVAGGVYESHHQNLNILTPYDFR